MIFYLEVPKLAVTAESSIAITFLVLNLELLLRRLLFFWLSLLPFRSFPFLRLGLLRDFSSSPIKKDYWAFMVRDPFFPPFFSFSL